MIPKISIMLGKPQADTLPAVQITNYPLEKGCYKPFVQAKFCLCEQGLFMRLLSFEAEVAPDSHITAAFCLAPNANAPILLLEAFCAHATTSLANSLAPCPVKARCRFFAGEDLQGIYWGVDALLPTHELRALFPQASFAKGARWKGNFYKLCSTPPFVHQGSFYPADFTQDDFITTSLGEFELIDY